MLDGKTFELERLSRTYTRGVGAFCAFCGALILAGWGWKLARLYGPFGSTRATIPITAACFILCGIALLLLSIRYRKLARVLGVLFGIVVLGIGTITLFEYLTGRVLIDNLFLPLVGTWPVPANNGRMAPNSAVSFLIVGLALVVTAFERPRWAERLGVVVAIVGILALTGYVYRVEYLYGAGLYAAMAPQTALLLCVIAFGIFAANPNGRILRFLVTPDTPGRVTRRLLAISVAAILFLGWVRALAVRAHYLDPSFEASIFLILGVLIVSWTILHLASFVQSVEQKRREAMDELQQSREWLSTILRSIGDGVIATDREGRITFMNAMAESMTGWNSDEAVGKPLEDVFLIINDLTGEAAENPVSRAILQNGITKIPGEVVLVARHDHRIPISDSAAPINAADGSVTGAVLVFRDVTARREAEKTNSVLASIVESSREAIFGTDLDGIITSWNRGAERMYGYTRDEILGKFVGILRPHHREAELEEILAALRRGERVGPLDTTRVRKDGREIHVSINVGPIKDKAGRIVGVSSVVRDITETKKAEEVLRATEKLAAAGRIAAVMAHEINNPLEAVTNLLYLLEQNPHTDAQSKEYIKIATRELGRVAYISKQTLAFYRESSKAEDLDLADLLSSLVSVMAPQFQSEGITVEQRYGTDLRVTAFPSELRQIFSNLLVNALDATGRGGVIHIHALRGHDWRGFHQEGVHVSIADNGPGIPKESLDKIFEPFVTTKGEKGTGLGLWVSEGIVQKHGGSIRVRSNTSGSRRGTCFTIFLPTTPKIQPTVVQGATR